MRKYLESKYEENWIRSWIWIITYSFIYISMLSLLKSRKLILLTLQLLNERWDDECRVVCWLPLAPVVVTLGVQPVLILVPPLLPLDVVLQRQVSQIALLLVIGVTHAHVVPRPFRERRQTSENDRRAHSYLHGQVSNEQSCSVKVTLLLTIGVKYLHVVLQPFREQWQTPEIQKGT